MKPLELVEESQVNFHPEGDRTFRFITIREVEVDSSLTEEEVILRMLSSPFYVDDLLRGVGEEELQIEVVHGPYLLNYIHLENFSSIDWMRARTKVVDWIGSNGELPSALRFRLMDIVDLLFTEERTYYELSGIDREIAEHSLGAGIGVDGFYEFLIFDSNLSKFWLFSCSDD